MTPEVKGTVLLDAITALQQRLGAGGYAHVLSLIDNETLAVLNGKIYPIAWYPLDVFVNFLQQSLVPRGDEESVLIQRSEEVVDRQLRGIYRMFVRLRSPAFVLKRIAVIHQTYFRGIHIESEFDQKNHATVRYFGFSSHHGLLENIITGFYQRALELSGAKHIKVVPSVPIWQGQEYCEFSISWS